MNLLKLFVIFIEVTVLVFTAKTSYCETTKKQLPYLDSLFVSETGKHIAFGIKNPKIEVGINLVILNNNSGEKIIIPGTDIWSFSPWSPKNENLMLVKSFQEFKEGIPENISDIPFKTGKNVIGSLFNQYLVNLETRKMFLYDSANYKYAEWSPAGTGIYVIDKGINLINISDILETNNKDYSNIKREKIFTPENDQEVYLIFPLPDNKRVLITISEPSLTTMTVDKIKGLYCLDLTNNELTEVKLPLQSSYYIDGMTFPNGATFFVLNDELLPFFKVNLFKQGLFLDEKEMEIANLTSENPPYWWLKTLYRIDLNDFKIERLFSFSTKYSGEKNSVSHTSAKLSDSEFLSKEGNVFFVNHGNISLFNCKDKSMTVLTSSENNDTEPVYNEATNALFFIRNDTQIIRKSLDDFGEKVVYELKD